MNYLFAITFSCFVASVGWGLHEMQSQKGNLSVTVHNPYNISLTLEMKCDYDAKNQKFDYYTKKALPRKGSASFAIPKKLKQCEVWPSR